MPECQPIILPVPPGTQTLAPPTLPSSHNHPSLPLTTIIFRVQGFPTAQEGVEEKCPVVDGQAQVAWLGLGTSGQVGAKCCHCDELHQFHIGHMAKTAVIRVNSSHLKKVSNWRPHSQSGMGEGSTKRRRDWVAPGPPSGKWASALPGQTTALQLSFPPSSV